MVDIDYNVFSWTLVYLFGPQSTRSTGFVVKYFAKIMIQIILAQKILIVSRDRIMIQIGLFVGTIGTQNFCSDFINIKILNKLIY